VGKAPVQQISIHLFILNEDTHIALLVSSFQRMLVLPADVLKRRIPICEVGTEHANQSVV
jgi:hypothetical protein